VRNDVASCGDVQVGKGSTGLVYQGRTKEGHKRVAIKKLDLSKQTDIPALENEISMISMSKTDTIVEYLGSYMWENQVRFWSLGFRVQDTFGALQWENRVRQWPPPRGTQHLYQSCARACALLPLPRSCARACVCEHHRGWGCTVGGDWENM
jgi:hypothetical protein